MLFCKLQSKLRNICKALKNCAIVWTGICIQLGLTYLLLLTDSFHQIGLSEKSRAALARPFGLFSKYKKAGGLTERIQKTNLLFPVFPPKYNIMTNQVWIFGYLVRRTAFNKVFWVRAFIFSFENLRRIF